MTDVLPTFRFDLTRLPSRGKQVHLEADEAQCTAIAAHIGVEKVDWLRADLQIDPIESDGALVEGVFTTALIQQCVVTLEPLPQNIAGEVSARFLPGERSKDDAFGAEITVEPNAEDPPEILDGSAVDLWAVVLESLVLAVDPFPRAKDAEIAPQWSQPDSDDIDRPSPFSVLASLRDGAEKSD